jgi:hypothetical protein
MAKELSIETVLVVLKFNSESNSLFPVLGLLVGRGQVAVKGAACLSVPVSRLEEVTMPLAAQIQMEENPPGNVNVCPVPTVGFSQ